MAIMYKVESWNTHTSLKKLNVVRVTEHTVLTDTGSRYRKECMSYELFDSFEIAKKSAINKAKGSIESLKSQLESARNQLVTFQDMKEE